jgi:hypothetical protein
MKESEVVKLLAIISAAWPSFELTEVRMQVWSQALADIDYAAGTTAVMRVLETSEFPPTVAAIRRAAIPARCMIPTADEAWAAVLEALSAGYVTTPRFDLIQDRAGSVAVEVAQAFGWRELYMSDAFNGVARGQFIRMYNAKAERRQEMALLDPLTRAQIEDRMNEPLCLPEVTE